MKHLDRFSQRVLALAISLSLVLFAGTLFVRSMPTVQASPFPETLSADVVEQPLATTPPSGSIQMQYQMIYDPDRNDYAHFVLVWDTDTGQSRMYYRDGTVYKASGGQLPQVVLD